jgi:nickel/cobalt transporter (NicO) family protein
VRIGIGTPPRTAIWAGAGLAVIVALAIAASSSGDVWPTVMHWVQATQRDLHDRLTLAVQAVDEHGMIAVWSLVGLSFLYGVFHAVGPGHGKVVIATYLLTQESEMRRGVALSFLAALAQGVTAIVAVEATVTLLDMPLRGASQTAAGFETVSYAAVLLLGMVLTVSALRRLMRRGHHHHHHHGDTSGHGDCGHSHGPAPEDLVAGASWRKGLAVIVSIGLRPCSGAILVLLLAYALQLTWAGIAAVLAMSLGTALTVSALAVLAVHARGFSVRLADRLPEGGNRLGAVIDLVALVGGLVVLALGASLLHMALTAPTHPLMMP